MPLNWSSSSRQSRRTPEQHDKRWMARKLGLTDCSSASAIWVFFRGPPHSLSSYPSVGHLFSPHALDTYHQHRVHHSNSGPTKTNCQHKLDEGERERRRQWRRRRIKTTLVRREAQKPLHTRVTSYLLICQSSAVAVERVEGDCSGVEGMKELLESKQKFVKVTTLVTTEHRGLIISFWSHGCHLELTVKVERVTGGWLNGLGGKMGGITAVLLRFGNSFEVNASAWYFQSF